MGKRLKNSFGFLGLLLLAISLFGCSSAQATKSSSSLEWIVKVNKVDVKDSLTATQAATQYDGSVINNTITKNPAAGDSYVIVNLTISAQGTDLSPFTWQNLMVRDKSGQSYARLTDDSFLEQYQYKPRLTGLNIKLGEATGWVCFELPTPSATSTLTLVYLGAGSAQTLTLK